ncbi:imidazolonepropionase [Desulfurispora thermophila]|uniref:imidazolonepropionase n=1 Tax=Desulfurispora thermophila TaxID=265470 RepID=UPI0003721FA4|nr:imidazolonepropionase [Desulfurispora thermophila]
MGEKVDLLLHSAAELITVAGGSARPRRGREMADIGLIRDGAVAVRDGRIVAVGPTRDVLERVETDRATIEIDARGKVVLPGLVDPHTHLVFAGSREYELEMKIAGVSYLEILARGGGILDTVRATRAASPARLKEVAQGYLREMLAQGTTTAEVKSGYGLDLETELKTLQVVAELNGCQPVELVPTFLGAHAVPPEYRDNPEAYVDLVVEEILPAVAGRGLARFCDVFCEEGVFSPEQTRRILSAARRLGLELKLHADEIEPLGGAELAAQMGATSADHLVQISEQGIRELANSNTVAVLLPATTFCLMGTQYAPARRMLEQGVAVALASDFNPGSSPVNSLPLVMGIACRQLKMRPAEVVTAVTINAAHAIGQAYRLGSLEPGKQADLVVFDAPSYQYIMYRLGAQLVDTVVKAGRVVWRRRGMDAC